MQGLRGRQHMPARQAEEPLQGLRGRRHMPARQAEERMQGLRGQLHMPARQAEERMQGLRGQLHMPARQGEGCLQGLQVIILRLVVVASNHSGYWLLGRSLLSLPPACANSRSTELQRGLARQRWCALQTCVFHDDDDGIC
jgi:hypothetical protein